MSELKAKYAYTLDEIVTISCHAEGNEYYHKPEVDTLLAKKDAEIESLKASHYAEMVDAGMRERRLRRALWKLKALYFFRMFQWCMEGKRLALEDDEPEDFFMECMGKYIKSKSEWGKEADMFDDARIVCIKKAEEYK